MTDPTPQELTNIADALTRIADQNGRATTPDDTADYYARCIIHAAVLNLRTAAGHDVGAPPKLWAAHISGRAQSSTAPIGAGMDTIPTINGILRRTLR